MAVSYRNEYCSIHYKINGSPQGGPYGCSEAWSFPKDSDIEVMRNNGLVLAGLRARMLPTDHYIVDCIGKTTDRKGKTFRCIDEPIQGTYLPDAKKLIVTGGNVSLGNITIPENGTPLSPVVVSDPKELFFVEHPKIAAFFRLESDDQERAIRAIHAIPDIWVGDKAPANLDAGHVWRSATLPTSYTVTASSINFWNNFTNFWDFLCKKSLLVRANPTYNSSGSGDQLMKYKLNAPTKVFFQKIDDAPVGAPFGLEVGRRY